MFSVTYWQNLDPRSCEVEGNTNGTSLVLSFWSLTGSENPWTHWGKGREKARDPLSKKILPRRYFQLLGVEPSLSSELRCQNSHQDLSDEPGNGAAPSSPSSVGCLQGKAGLTPAWRRGETENRCQHILAKAKYKSPHLCGMAASAGVQGVWYCSPADFLILAYGFAFGNIKHQLRNAFVVVIRGASKGPAGVISA